jgi:O-succinylbenzoate synthase
MRIADDLGIKYWITSALESNIGLNAIAQWTATLDINLPQGLGTGSLFKNNINSPLEVEKGYLYYDSKKDWDLTKLENLFYE